MSNARKCDRVGCGKFFDPMNSEGEMARFRNPFFQTSEDLEMNSYGSFLLDKSNADTLVDLCPECTREFRDFMTNPLTKKFHFDPSKITNASFPWDISQLIGGDRDGDV